MFNSIIELKIASKHTAQNVDATKNITFNSFKNYNHSCLFHQREYKQNEKSAKCTQQSETLHNKNI